MKIASLTEDINYQPNRPAISVLLDSDSGKEIRIAFKKGQEMKRHQAPFPIVIEIFEGKIDFGVGAEDDRVILERGKLISLEGSVPHDLIAMEDSIVRLSLNKADSAGRVKDVAKKS